MGCGCAGGAAQQAAKRTVIKYEFNGVQYDTQQKAVDARTAAGGAGTIKTVAVAQ